MMGFGLLFVLLLVGAVAYAGGWRPQFGQWSQTGYSVGRTNNAVDLLRERYARGEITREQYQEMRDELSR